MERNRYIKEIVMGVLLLLVYLPTFVWMWQRWTASESYYGHGILIPLVSLFIIYRRRELLRWSKKSNELVGLIIVVCGLFVHIICALLRVYFLSGFSFVFVLYGLILFMFGKEITSKITFPIWFLLSMIPLPLVLIGNLTVRLKLFAAQCATLILNRIGFPAMLDGNIIRMAKSFIIVGAPCSGLRSLIALLTLGLIFSYTIKVSFLKKGFFFLSAMPIAIASNILRITVLAIVNDLYGQEAASGFFHDFSGFLVFAFAFVGLFIVGRILEVEKFNSSQVERKHSGRRS
jgi:exosortase